MELDINDGSIDTTTLGLVVVSEADGLIDGVADCLEVGFVVPRIEELLMLSEGAIVRPIFSSGAGGVPLLNVRNAMYTQIATPAPATRSRSIENTIHFFRSQPVLLAAPT